MFTAEVVAEIPAWNARKLAQWANVAPTVEHGTNPDGSTKAIVHGLEHLSLIRSGEGQTCFMLNWGTDDGFYESVIIGQLPQIHKVPKNPKKPAVLESDWRPAAPAEIPRAKLRIDLTDDQIDSVIAAWSRNKTALDLAFVPSVWRRDGLEYVRPGQK
jgi:hypothetical protein